MDKEERRKKKIREKRKKEKKKKAREIWTFYDLNPTGEVIFTHIFQKDFNSTQEVTPPEESEPELFLDEPEP